MKRGKILVTLIIAIVLIPVAVYAWTWRRRAGFRPGFRPGFHFRVGPRYPRYYPSGATLLETRDALNSCENRVDDRDKEIVELKIENANLKEASGKCELRVDRESKTVTELEIENRRLQEKSRQLEKENKKLKADLAGMK